MKSCPYCAEQIQDEAILCRFCNRDVRPAAAMAPGGPAADVAIGRRRTAITIAVVSVVLLLFFALFVAMALSGGLEDSELRRARQLDAQDRQMADEIPTMETFLKIQNGMSYADVVRIIGREGALSVSSDSGGRIYTWKRARCCANMSVHLRDDRVISKSQAGLD